MRQEDAARCSEGHPRLREAELLARQTAAFSRRFFSSPGYVAPRWWMAPALFKVASLLQLGSGRPR
jgi:hypothetical protein